MSNFAHGRYQVWQCVQSNGDAIECSGHGVMGQLTTHVLDTSAGIAAAGVRVELLPLDGAPAAAIVRTTGSDGRCAALLADGDFRAGRYALTYHTAAYFRARGIQLPEPAFFEQAVIRIGIADASQHYHVPLLISPWSYSVYRGT
jgi:5-hydroxyisourate hydrolase